MNNLDKTYTSLLQDILKNGVEKKDRTGTGTLSVFGRQIRHKMSEGFPLLTTKKMHWKSIVTELLWFLRGDTNIKYLIDNDCHIWDGDAYKNYDKLCIDVKWMEPVEKDLNGEVYNMGRKYTQEAFINRIKTDDAFAKTWGELGPIYGKQWRSWREGEYTTPLGLDGPSIWKEGIDQITNLINDLKTNPDSRRLMVSAWNVGELDQMVLPPCHYGFQVYTREMSVQERQKYDNHFDSLIGEYPDHHITLDKRGVPRRAISLMWNQRSVDVPLGLPFNIASYGLLLEIIAKAVNMVPDEMIGNLGDCHVYLNQIDGVKEHIGRELTDEERYNIWFDNNYETGMERWFDPNKLPDFDNTYYDPTPKRTREPYPLPTLNINTEFWPTQSGECSIGHIDAQAVFRSFSDINFCKCLMEEDIQLKGYRSHPVIKIPLSN